MKIIEALKELPLIEKKINKNMGLIHEYCADVDNGQMSLPFGTIQQQRKEVDALLQSTKDLVARDAVLRKNLALTNATVKVDIGSEWHSITEWIALRTRGIDNKIKMWGMLGDSVARTKLNSVPFDTEKGIKIVRFYDEKTKNEQLERLEEIKGQIDSKLEMVNATTDLIEKI